jgi:hypothetical protein
MRSSLLVLLITIMTSAAQAGFYIEPYLGYDSSTSKGDVTLTSPTSSVVTINVDEVGARFGAKIGYAAGSWIFGIDALTGELSDSSDDKTTHTDAGVFVAYRFDKKYSAALGYNATSSVETDDFELTGSGFRLGIGAQVHERIKLSVDYIMATLDELDYTGVVGKSDIEVSSVVVTVGFPFEF